MKNEKDGAYLVEKLQLMFDRYANRGALEAYKKSPHFLPLEDAATPFRVLVRNFNVLYRVATINF